MQLDLTRPSKLYRYGELKWLAPALRFGEFRVRPAADYKDLVADRARYDDELVRIRRSPGAKVTVTKLESGQQLKPIGEVTYQSAVGSNYLTLCFSERWDELLFDGFAGTDACLLVHDVQEFAERLHTAVEAALPDWAGMDGRVSYGGASPLGPVFAKPIHHITQHEWRFAWRPPAASADLAPLSVRMGSIERIAEIVLRSPSARSGA